jgi:cytochrome c-type biogenesis protein CcmF
VIFWGTFFPLISEAVTGDKASVGPPWFDRYTVPLALLLVLLSGVGPLLAWRRVSRESVRRLFAGPVAVAATVTATALLFTRAGDSPPSVAMFAFASFAIAAVLFEYARAVRTQRSVSGEWHGAALAAVVRRNRRRYGGYLVHLGVAVLMLGIAASSAFNTSRDVRLGPGETARVAGYDVRYVRPTADLSNEKLTFGAVVDVRRDGERVALLRPSRNYYAAQDLSMGTLGRFFRGESTSEVGLRAGLRRDIWTAMQPDLRVLNAPIREANRRFADASPRVQGILIAALAERYLNKRPPATFRVIVNPMVTWIWIGGLIVLSGALMALWPSAVAVRRRVVSLAGARLGREPARA